MSGRIAAAALGATLLLSTGLRAVRAQGIAWRRHQQSTRTFPPRLRATASPASSSWPRHATACCTPAHSAKPTWRTVVAAIQLFEQKRFALDDPAEQYVPELANLKVIASFDAATGAYTVRPASNRVTIRQLFTHTSGLGYGFTSPIVRDFKPRGLFPRAHLRAARHVRHVL